MIRINLLPIRAAQKKEMLFTQIVVLVLTLSLVSVACIAFHMVLLGKVNTQKELISETKTEIESLKRKIGEVGRFEKQQKALQGKLDVLDKLKQAKAGPVHLLDDLSLALPDEVWLDSFDEKGGGVSLKGVGLNEEVVADFMRRLEASPYFKNVELKVIQQKELSGTKIQKFSLTCQTETPAKKPKK